MRLFTRGVPALVLVSCIWSSETSAAPQVTKVSSPGSGVVLRRPGDGLGRTALAPRSTAEITGVVELADGTPVVGAVVVTAAGGNAFTGPTGVFTLDLASIPRSGVSVTVVADVDEVSHSANVHVPASDLTSGKATGIGVIVVQPVECSAGWLPTFGAQPGAEGTVRFLGVLDDGTGPALFAGGDFEGIGSAGSYGVARWNGSEWSPLGEGIGGGTNSRVYALETLQVGSQPPQLFAAGRFTFNSPIARGIALFDPETGEWDRFGNSYLQGDGHALEEFDDGSGNALYIGGDFGIGGVAGGSTNLVRWDGQAWSGVGSLLGGSGIVHALLAHDDGGGAALYAGGNFTTAGGVAASALARWDGATWSQVGAGMIGTVRALAEFDDGQGDGTVLYAAGYIRLDGDTVWRAVVRWDGTSWSAIEANTVIPTNWGGEALATATVDGTQVLVVGGNFYQVDGNSADRVACWDGIQWSPLPLASQSPGASGFYRPVSALASFALPGGAETLFAGGEFLLREGDAGDRIACWSDSGWEALGQGANDSVRATAVFDDGSGPGLYAGGSFTSVGGQTADRIARWDGASWSPIGDIDGSVYALDVFDEGSGPALFVGGSFDFIDGLPIDNLARWDGASWSEVGGGIGIVYSLLAVGAGSPLGPAIYAGGWFDSAGGGSAHNIVRWDGTSYQALGNGLGFALFGDHVRSLGLFDDGTGEELYAGGSFEFPGASIARWNGSAWNGIGDITVVVGFPSPTAPGNVLALAAHDDGSGPALYVGGGFDTVDGVPADNVARFDGTTWSALPGTPLSSDGTGAVSALRVHDDGTGPALYAGGGFGFSGSTPPTIRGIARWSGSGWTQVGGGTTQEVYSLGSYRVPGSPRPSLFAGGRFSAASDSGDSYLAQWGCDP